MSVVGIKLDRSGSLIRASTASRQSGSVYVAFTIACKDEPEAIALCADKSPEAQAVIAEIMELHGTELPAGEGTNVVRADVVLARIEQKRARG